MHRIDYSFACSEDRFWRRIDVRGPDDCWPWRDHTARWGYGNVAVWEKRSTMPAHKRAYELACGPVPVGLNVCHHCDNPPCCNPGDLFVGTQKENLADRRRKGRSLSGERNVKAKLTWEQVRSIRQSIALGRHGIGSRLAREYGVSESLISAIKYGRIWNDEPAQL